MIKELAEFGKRIRKGHDALKDEPISIALVIKEDGSFESFSVIDKIFRPAESITAKKGKARLLLYKPEEVLCFVSPREMQNAKNDLAKAQKSVESKHALYLEKLNKYKHLEVLKPVFQFYYENRENGLVQALQRFPVDVDEKEFTGNLAFRLNEVRLHEHQDVYDSIIERFEKEQAEQLKKEKRICSVCGEAEYPIVNKPHGYIKSVPGGQEGKNVLVSYNENAFESYGLVKNFNSSICTNCSKNYVEGLNWLLTNGNEQLVETKGGKSKKQFVYTNRRKFGKDTAMIFWTRENTHLDEFNLLDTPDAGQVKSLIDSVFNANAGISKRLNTNKFYSCTLSGAAARIAIRDWIEISLNEYKRNIAQWFQDIAIRAFGEIRYTPLYALARAAQSQKADKDPTDSRTAAYLWNAALKRSTPPLWILSAVLKRIRFVEANEDGASKETLTPARAALIRFILNRNNKKGGYMIKEQSDPADTSSAIVCGKIFAVMENIQRAALGKNLNAGIRERFFSFASTSPSPAFGRLMKLSQNHISKLKHEKPGLAVMLDKQLQHLCSSLVDFPAIFSLEEQGQFALGYYHQKQEDYDNAQSNKELKELIIETEE